jgi:hypothetical protein
MMIRSSPLSNAERQRMFLERHPGYYRRLRAKRRAEELALSAAQAAAAAAPARREPLMLPAPVEMPLFPGINEIPATLDALRESARVSLPLSNERAR